MPWRNSYFKGQGVDADPEASFYWYLKSAHQGCIPAMFKAASFLKNGMGVNRSAQEALKLFLQAASQGDLQSCSQLGSMYYYGEGGVPKDLESSFCYRKKAADGGDREALADLGWMYEKGQGTDRNFQKALDCYQTVAQSINSIQALYGVARMHDLLGNHSEAIRLYEKTIEETAKTTNETSKKAGYDHANALYRLAFKYEKGLGTSANHAKAVELFKRAAKTGHIPSLLKLKLLERPSNDTTLCSFDDMAGMTSEIQLYYIRESKRVLEEVMKDYKVTSPFTFEEGIDGQLYVVSDREQVLHVIKQDYLDARRVLMEVKEERKDDLLSVNYEFITCDPYIKYYFVDVTKEISDQEVTDVALENLFLEMGSAVQAMPSYNPDIIEQLHTIEGKFLIDPEQIHVRKRLVSRYRIWTNEKHLNCLPVPPLVTDCLQYRQGQAAINFSQNSARCLDGFSEYLEHEEAKDINGSHAGMSLGGRISKVLNCYKEEFLLKHRNTSPLAIEEAVEAMRLLKERMRLPFGLPGAFSPMLYGIIGKGNSEIYKPIRVMERFMRGGSIPERPGIIIEPYTCALLIKLLKQSLSKEKSPLGTPHLNLFIVNNRELKMLCEDAMDEGEENEYFDPNSGGADFYKDALFIKLLVDHGYLLRR